MMETESLKKDLVHQVQDVCRRHFISSNKVFVEGLVGVTVDDACILLIHLATPVSVGVNVSSEPPDSNGNHTQSTQQTKTTSTIVIAQQPDTATTNSDYAEKSTQLDNKGHAKKLSDDGKERSKKNEIVTEAENPTARDNNCSDHSQNDHKGQADLRDVQQISTDNVLISTQNNTEVNIPLLSGSNNFKTADLTEGANPINTKADDEDQSFDLSTEPGAAENAPGDKCGKTLHHAQNYSKEPKVNCSSGKDEKKSDASSPNHKKPKQFSCPECNYKSLYKCNLKRHLYLHKRGCDNVCRQCGSSFRDATMLRDHVQVYHEGCPFRCPSPCSKTFVSKRALLYHRQTHNKTTKYSCDRCQREFASSSHYHSHANLCKNLPRPPIKPVSTSILCDECGKHFKNEETYKEHAKSCSIKWPTVSADVGDSLKVSTEVVNTSMNFVKSLPVVSIRASHLPQASVESSHKKQCVATRGGEETYSKVNPSMTNLNGSLCATVCQGLNNQQIGVKQGVNGHNRTSESELIEQKNQYAPAMKSPIINHSTDISHLSSVQSNESMATKVIQIRNPINLLPTEPVSSNEYILTSDALQSNFSIKQSFNNASNANGSHVKPSPTETVLIYGPFLPCHQSDASRSTVQNWLPRQSTDPPSAMEVQDLYKPNTQVFETAVGEQQVPSALLASDVDNGARYVPGKVVLTNKRSKVPNKTDEFILGTMDSQQQRPSQMEVGSSCISTQNNVRPSEQGGPQTMEVTNRFIPANNNVTYIDQKNRLCTIEMVPVYNPIEKKTESEIGRLNTTCSLPTSACSVNNDGGNPKKKGHSNMQTGSSPSNNNNCETFQQQQLTENIPKVPMDISEPPQIYGPFMENIAPIVPSPADNSNDDVNVDSLSKEMPMLTLSLGDILPDVACTPSTGHNDSFMDLIDSLPMFGPYPESEYSINNTVFSNDSTKTMNVRKNESCLPHDTLIQMAEINETSSKTANYGMSHGETGSGTSYQQSSDDASQYSGYRPMSASQIEPGLTPIPQPQSHLSSLGAIFPQLPEYYLLDSAMSNT